MRKKETKDYNCNDFWYIWRDNWKTKGLMENWTIKDRSLMKRLITEVGAVTTYLLVVFFLTHWDDLSSQYGFRGMPNVGCMYGFRSSLLKDSTAWQKKRTHLGEFSGVISKGWGD
jgi:hypothetical protein